MLSAISTITTFALAVVLGTASYGQTLESPAHRIAGQHDMSTCPAGAERIDYCGASRELSRGLARFRQVEVLQIRRAKALDFQVLLSLPNLQSVILESAGEVSTEAFTVLAQVKSLRRLDLSHATCSANALRQLRDSPALTEVSLGGAAVNGDIIGALAGIPELSTLDLSRLRIDSKPSTPLSKLACVRTLRVNGNDWVDEAVCAELPPELVSLEVFGCRKINDEAISRICRHIALKELGINSSQITQDGAAELAKLRQLERFAAPGATWVDSDTVDLLSNAPIKRLDLSWCENVSYVVTGLLVSAFPQLEELDLSGCNLGDHASEDLAELQNLTVLRLERTRIANQAAAEIAGLRSLVDLNIAHTKVSGAVLRQFGELDRLQHLDISGLSASDDEWSECLVWLGELRSLTVNHWKWVGKLALTRIGTLPNLTRLSLAYTSFPKADIGSAVRPSLLELNLSGTSVDDESLEVIMTRATDLRVLWITGCSISAAGIRGTAARTTLTQLVISWHSVRGWSDDFKAFRDQHPHVEIFVTNP